MDQEKIILLLNTLAQDLRKSGLENLFVDQKMTTATGNFIVVISHSGEDKSRFLTTPTGEEVKLPKLPKSILAKEADATSTKMIDELKEMTSKLGREVCACIAFCFCLTCATKLDDLHSVADSASKTLVSVQVQAPQQ